MASKTFDKTYFDQIVSLLLPGLLLDRYPARLSGGEKQRVAIGRALLSKASILLMDEPLASLDLPRKREVMPFLENLSETVHLIIYVTHSLTRFYAWPIILWSSSKAKLFRRCDWRSVGFESHAAVAIIFRTKFIVCGTLAEHWRRLCYLASFKIGHR